MGRTTHGYTKGIRTKGLGRTYRIWQGMRRRCENGHPAYGGRGIRVCARWQSFGNFLEDIGEIPTGMSIDRIDVDRGYEPGNVRIVDSKAQTRNRRSNRIVIINGESRPLSEWAEIASLPLTTLANRLKNGWTGERLLAPSGSTRDRPLTINGENRTLAEWSRECGVGADVIWKRLQRGWTPEDAVKPNGANGQNYPIEFHIRASINVARCRPSA